EAMLSSLGLSDEKRRRLKFPAGLDIGAVTAEEIALSILAEMVQVRRAHAKAAAPEPTLARDPICGMTVDVGAARHVLEKDGTTYYFCCAGCKEKFAHAV
ncbi:MAG: YHS domain-containing protein, partial [Vicinamibacteria bacterium]